jgi:hypothetical protein
MDAGRHKEGKAELDQAVALDPSLASRIPDRIAADLESLSGASGVTASPTPTG